MKKTLQIMALLLICGLFLSACDKKEKAFSPPKFNPLNIELEEKLLENQPIKGFTGVSLYQDKIYASDSTKNQVLCFNKDFVEQGKFGETGSRDGELLNPQGIVADDSGIHVLDWGNKRIARFDSNGKFIENVAITEKIDSQTIVFGFAHKQGVYYISCSFENFEPKVLIAEKGKETKALSSSGVGGFFDNNGVVHLLTRFVLRREAGQNILSSPSGGEIYELQDGQLKKVGQSYLGLTLSPFVRFGDDFVAFSSTLNDIETFKTSNYELIGSMRLLKNLYPNWSSDKATKNIFLQSDGSRLYFIWPDEGFISILSRKER